MSQAAQDYFRSERAGLLFALMFAGVLVGVAVWLASSGVGFRRGLAGALVAQALLLLGTGLPLLIRDRANEARFVESSARGDESWVPTERARMKAVVDRFPGYFVGYGATLLLSGVLVLAWRNEVVRGIATGLAFFAVFALIVDDVSHRRARGYADTLHAEVTPSDAP
ncbi:hypothetical protein [Cystobacter ferrugineus]|uniref:Uncharacterized protein n=1 Tax=Cystobacter ferrugineus TaxID=83449 RepID=A0A1L9AVW5_9BACT|nr:hypothetical protein [Cystobacter ferrugineus]OJH34155.1 hypothetical protein BON30_45180 [Cystobacter ferrugineus]